MESQVSELGTIRRSLFDLEAQHERAHSHYEDEIKRIRSELLAARGSAPVSLGIPGRSPRQLGAPPVPLPSTPAMSEHQSGSQLLRHRALERDLPERDFRDRTRDDLDRVGDQHDVKRQKTRRNYSGSYFFRFASIVSPQSDILWIRPFRFKAAPNFLQGVQLLMRRITTPLACSASPRIRHNHVSTILQR